MRVPIGAPKSLTDCRRLFLVPASAKQRAYEALRAYFVEGLTSAEAARAFGYTPGSFRVLCHQFRRDPAPQFFATPNPGPRSQPFKTAARGVIVDLRKRNHSIYEISQALRERRTPLSPTAVREVLREEGFAALPRRLDEERPGRPSPSDEAIADVRSFALKPGRFRTRCGGLFLFVPALVKLGIDTLADEAGLPGSKMIPAAHALRASLATKLWSIDRKSHVMALAADPGLALFSGLPATPKKSFLSEYSSRIHHAKTMRLLAAWHAHLAGDKLFDGSSFNLDFHSVPYFGEHPLVESHYVAMRSRSQPSVLAFMAHDANSRAFCYANSDLRKGEEADEIFRFIEFWKSAHGHVPTHLVFDSKLTTYANLARLDQMGITFITLRRRTHKLLAEVASLPLSAWRTITLDVPTRKYKTPRIFEQTVRLAGVDLRQLYVQDLGHDQPTILLTNDRSTAPKLITRYAQRMLIENALSDAVRFFHMDALSSSVGLKVDFDLTLLVIANTLYRLLARDMRGYDQAQARQIFRDLVDMPADIVVKDNQVTVEFHRRAHLPILLASDLFKKPVAVPWWNGARLKLSTYAGTPPR
jgi:hypothetical protein